MGTDLFSATSRFTFGRVELLGGIDFIIVAIGVFAWARCSATWSPRSAGHAAGAEGAAQPAAHVGGHASCRFAFVNGSVVGFLIGILPGAGSTIASFMSYGIEKAVSKHPEEFGHGAIEGVAAPEGANNAETAARWCRSSRSASRQRHDRDPAGRARPVGIQAGPLFIQDSPQLFWGSSPACTSATSCC
jgi:putative tricarboxylic transport membrane protein